MNARFLLPVAALAMVAAPAMAAGIGTKHPPKAHKMHKAKVAKPAKGDTKAQ